MSTRSHPSTPANRPDHPPSVPDHTLLLRIGSGSYGEVWLAKNSVGTPRAVKVVFHHAGEKQESTEREFAGLCRYEPVSRTHEGLVDILHLGRTEDYFYYVMELADPAQGSARAKAERPAEGDLEPVEGSHTRGQMTDAGLADYAPMTLESVLRRRGRMPVAECVELGLVLAGATGFLHRQGLLHRDIKPSNIIFVGGIPKLADIGLVADARDAKSMVGTPGYIPPEGHGTVQGDIFSLGRVLYECASGKDRKEFPSLPSELADLADRAEIQEFNELLLKACDRDPQRRYASTSELLSDLLVLQRGESLRRLRGQAARWRAMRRVGGIAALLAVLAFAGFLHERRNSQRLERVARESHDRLIRLHVANGARSLDANDTPGSLLWFLAALKLAQGDSEAELIHRYRFQAVWQSCPRVSAIGRHDSGRILSVAFNHDGSRFLTSGSDGSVRVWDTKSGESAGPLLRHDASVGHATFSPDGGRIATACDDKAMRVWDTVSGSQLGPAMLHEGPVEMVQFSADGTRIVTASDDQTARVWDTATGVQLTPLLHHERKVNTAEFSADGARVVTASDDNTASIWDTQLGERVCPALVHGDRVRSASFDPKGERVVTACRDGTARVWEVATGKPLTPPLRHSGPLWTAQFSPDGRWVQASGGSGLTGGQARVWDAVTGEPVSVPFTHQTTIRRSLFGRDAGYLVTASHDRTAQVWNVLTGQRIAGPLPHDNNISEIALSPDGKFLLSAGISSWWRLWDLRPLRESRVALRSGSDLGYARMAPDGSCIVAIRTNQSVLTALLLDGNTGHLVRELGAHPAAIKWTSFSPDSHRVLTACADGLVRVWDVRTGDMVVPPLRQGSFAHRAEFSPDARFVVSVGSEGDPVAKVWDLAARGALVWSLSHAHAVWNAAFSYDGRMLATAAGGEESSGDGEVRIWSVTQQRLLYGPLIHSGPVRGAIWSPTGTQLITFSMTPSEPGIGMIWQLTPSKVPTATREHFTRAQFSSNGKLLATGGADGTVTIWDAERQTIIAKWRASLNNLGTIAFSPDGRRLFTGGGDGGGMVLVWDARTGEQCSPPLLSGDPTCFIDVSADGRRVLGSGFHRSILCDLPPTTLPVARLEMLAQLASCARLGSTGGADLLSPEELAQLLQRVRTEAPRE